MKLNWFQRESDIYMVFHCMILSSLPVCSVNLERGLLCYSASTSWDDNAFQDFGFHGYYGNDRSSPEYKLSSRQESTKPWDMGSNRQFGEAAHWIFEVITPTRGFQNETTPMRYWQYCGHISDGSKQLIWAFK